MIALGCQKVAWLNLQILLASRLTSYIITMEREEEVHEWDGSYEELGMKS
jgi:hypothetical protein